MAVPGDDLVVGTGLVIPAVELGWRFSRSSGPGGQHVNTTDSRVELVWDLGTSAVLGATARARLEAALSARLRDGVLTVTVSDHRSQHRNRELALARLASLVEEGLRPPRPRRATRPTKGSRRRRLDAKKRRSETKSLRRRPGD